MSKPTSSARNLAQRVVAASRTGSSTTDPQVHESVLVIEKLRISLTRFAGAEGFASLLRRALALARAEAPALESVKIGADGRLDGTEVLAADSSTGAEASNAAVAITAHLLGLLITFIGEPFTLRLVREAWPNASVDEYDTPKGDS